MNDKLLEQLQPAKGVSSEELMSSLNLAGQQDQGSAILEKLKANQPLNKGDWVGILAAAIIPALAGAAAGGKKGALAGIAAGTKGAAFGLDKRQQNIDSQNAIDMQNAKYILSQQQQEDAIKLQLAKEARDSENKRIDLANQAEKELFVKRQTKAEGIGGDGQNITIDTGGKELSRQKVLDTISEQEGPIAATISLRDRVLGLAEKYTGLEGQEAIDAIKNGSVLDQYKEVAGRKIESIFGLNSDARELEADLEGATAEQGSALLKGTLSDRDMGLIRKAIRGGDYAGLATIYNQLGKAETKMLGNALGKVDRLSQSYNVQDEDIAMFLDRDAFKFSVQNRQDRVRKKYEGIRKRYETGDEEGGSRSPIDREQSVADIDALIDSSK